MLTQPKESFVLYKHHPVFVFESRLGVFEIPLIQPREGLMISFQSGNWLGTSPDLLLPRLRSLAEDVERFLDGRPMDIGDQAVRIEEWAVMRRAVPCLVGQMTGHPTILDGRPGITSEVYFFDEHSQFARTLSRWYRLDRPMLGGNL